MYPIDKKMLQLLEILKSKGVIRFDSNFCTDIGLLKQNLNNIKNNPKNHFTLAQVYKAIKTYNVNANWIFGRSNQVFLTQENNSQTRTQKSIIH